MKKALASLLAIVLAAALLGGCTSTTPASKTEALSGGTVASLAPSQTVFVPRDLPETIQHWAVEPSIEADEIRPLISEETYHLMEIFGPRAGNAYRQTRDDYFWQVSVIEQGGNEGLVEMTGEIVYEVNQPIGGITQGLLFSEKDNRYIAQCIFTKHQPENPGGTYYNWLDNDYKDNGPVQITAQGHTSHLLWDEEEHRVWYLYAKEAAGPAEAIKYERPLPVMLAKNIQNDDKTIVSLEETHLYGYAQDNQLLVPCMYEAAQHPWEEIGAVKEGGKWYYVTMQNQRLNEEGFDAVHPESEGPWGNMVFDFSEGLVAVNRGGKWGYMDKYGQEVIPCQYEAARPVHRGKAWVKQGGLWGVADLEEYLP